MVRSFYKDGKIVGGQKKIASAAKPFDKITGEDFKALKFLKGPIESLYLFLLIFFTEKFFICVSFSKCFFKIALVVWSI